MREEPDIVGLTLEDAVTELEACGWEFEIVVTRPDRRMPDGRKRVVCFTPSDGKKGLLIVACEVCPAGDLSLRSKGSTPS